MTRYLFPILIVICAIVTYELYIQPLYLEIGPALAREAEMEAALLEADAAQAKLDEIAERYESFPIDATERLAEIIPETIDPIRLLIDATAFLERNGFSAKSLTVVEGMGGTGDGSSASYRTHTISFTLSASYDTFREFLHTLEASLAFRDTATVTFTTASSANARVGGKPELAIHDYNIQITSYSLR